MLNDDEKTDTNKPRPEHELPLRLRNSAIHRKYSLKEVISGDFAGTLYATAKRSGGKAIAVKVLNEGYALLSNSIGNIEHSRICQILHTIIERETIQAVVLEKPDGAPLSAMILEQGALPPGQVVSAGLQLLSALHAVHWNDASVGNLHSDSIFLSRDRQGNLDLQLTNLGIGCIQDKLRETDYLAPEQIMGGKSGGKTADIWAVGVILYEMLVGTRPFRGENRYAVAGEILLQEPDYSKIPEAVPADLTAIIRRALEKDESKRFQDVAEMVSELLPFQSEFNEPMSPAAEIAIRESYPPRPMGEQRISSAAKTAAPTTAAVPKARVIPTVRISHTPSDPPTGIRKTGNPLRDDPKRSGKKTKMGMPAISLPAKRIPLKSHDDTASFATSASKAPAAGSGDPAKGARAVPGEATVAARGKGVAGRALSVVAKTASGVRDTLKSASQKISQSLPKLLENPPKPAEIKDRFMALSLQKKGGVIAAGVVLLALPVLLIVAVGEETPHAMEENAKTLARTSEARLLVVEAERTAKLATLPAVLPPEVVFPKAPSGKKIRVKLNGRLPRRHKIKINGKRVTPPIILEATDVPAALTIDAKGFDTFSQVFIPLDDIVIEVDMQKETGESQKPYPVKPVRKKGKSKKERDNLASNPFG